MNKLVQDQLDMLDRLQPFFAEKMGGWEHGDPCVLNGIEDVYCEDCVGDNIYSDSVYKKAIRVPKAYDWKNPERGLWCMVDWTKFYLAEHHGTVDIHKDTDEILCLGADPFTALLKTLCEQEGV